MRITKPFTLSLGNGETVVVTEVEDVDLDIEPITLSDGTVLDEAAAERYGREVADRAWASRAGRPSLSGGPTPSPRLGVRLPIDLDKRLRERADAEHKRPSEVVREALEKYLSA